MNFNQKIITSGVYVNVAGFFPFQVGPTKSGKTLGIARLGGHREGNETGWECAAREACEEASLHVVHLNPPATYWAENTAETELSELQVREWHSSSPDDVAPILVTRRNEEYITLSISDTLLISHSHVRKQKLFYYSAPMKFTNSLLKQ